MVGPQIGQLKTLITFDRATNDDSREQESKQNNHQPSKPGIKINLCFIVNCYNFILFGSGNWLGRQFLGNQKLC